METARTKILFTLLLLSAAVPFVLFSTEEVLVAKGEGKGDKGVMADGGDTSLMVTAFCGDLEGMQLLLEGGADVDGTNSQGDTPLMIAA